VGSGWSAHCCIVLLFNVSGQICSLVGVCVYCVLDVGFRSVIVCCLMGEWMNVFYAVIAHWLFFFQGQMSFTCSGVSPSFFLGFCAVIFCWISADLMLFHPINGRI